MSRKSEESPLERKLRVLVSLNGEETAFLRRLETNVRRLPPRSALIMEGEAIGRVVSVREGWAMRFKTLSDGRRQITNFAIPGDVIGLYADLLEVADHSVATLTEAEVCEFSPDLVVELFQKFPKLAVAFVWTGAREEAMLAEKTACLGRRTAYERLAHMLLELLRRLQIIDMAGDDRFDLPISQEIIADVLGLSTVHVNRTLNRLRADGLIETDGQAIHLKDIEALREAADFDEGYLHHRRMPRRLQKQLSV